MTAKPQQLRVRVCDRAVCVATAAAARPSLLSGGMCLSFHAGCHPEVPKGSRPAFKTLHKAPTVNPGGLSLGEKKKNTNTSMNMISNDRIVFKSVVWGNSGGIVHDSHGLGLGICAARLCERWQQGSKKFSIALLNRMQCGNRRFAFAKNWNTSLLCLPVLQK